MDEFNRDTDDFRGAVSGLRVFGPSWAVEGAEHIDVATSKLAELAFIMQGGVSAEHMESVNADLPELDRLVNEYVNTVSHRYDGAPSPSFSRTSTWRPKVAGNHSARPARNVGN